MEYIPAILAFVQAHGADILAAYGALVVAATAIVKLTPTQSDDNALAKVVKLLDWVSTVAHRQPPSRF
jgi:hypothetical protein